jgi:signal transduction histidine kinase
MKIGWGIARVAAIASAVVVALYAVVMIPIDVSYFRSQITDADSQVIARIALLAHDFRDVQAPGPEGRVPLYSWLYGTDGQVEGFTSGAPPLPAKFHPTSPTSIDTEGRHFRVNSVPVVDLATGGQVGWVVVGRNVDDVYASTLRLALIQGALAAPLALLVFLGAVLIARRAVAPVEDARRRQLAFTADASHELRTPLTVIEAEASLALQKDRDAESYRTSIERIAGEGARLRRIVEDLLWLARFESEPDRPAALTVDVGEVATASVSRFRHVADQRGLHLSGRVTSPVPPLITAPPEWIDRLAGVLVDNACRYTTEGGTVEVSVVSGDGRVRLAVDDSGPGIPPEERARIFDRFHRANSKPGGAGLGLAIGNAIVNATGGRWEVAASPTGGTRMAVHWPLVKLPRELEPSEDAPRPAPEAQAG